MGDPSNTPSMRDEAVRIVDTQHGYTVEQSHSPEQHRFEYDAVEEQLEILDACCGGRMWWWDKSHPLALYMDTRVVPAGSVDNRPNWRCEPDVVGDFREMDFPDETFRMVVFDPPHNVRSKPSGRISTMYGALHPETEQDDLRRGLSECWRVLAPGGTLVFRWAGSLDRVERHFPATPIVGNRIVRNSSGLGSRWIIFYKPLPR